MKPHKHAAIIKAYAERAQVSETPWDIIQIKSSNGVDWIDLYPNPNFSYGRYEYRIKPRTININDFEVPEPVSCAPDIGSDYFVVDLPGVDHTEWHGVELEYEWLNAGIIHLTREAAEIHAKALLSFTKK